MLCSSMAWIRKRGQTKDGRGRYLVEWRDPSGTRRGQTVVGRDAALGLKPRSKTRSSLAPTSTRLPAA